MLLLQALRKEPHGYRSKIYIPDSRSSLQVSAVPQDLGLLACSAFIVDLIEFLAAGLQHPDLVPLDTETAHFAQIMLKVSATYCSPC